MPEQPAAGATPVADRHLPPGQRRRRGTTTTVAGCAVERRGPADAPAVVMLHGGAGTGAHHWGRAVDDLADRWRCLLVDLPGHGQSPPLAPGEEAHGAAEGLGARVARLLDDVAAADGTPPAVAGFSMGGIAAMRALVGDPGRVSTLVLVGVNLREHPKLSQWRRTFDVDHLERAWPLLVDGLRRLHEPQGGPEAWREVVARDAGAGIPELPADRLVDVSAPVLLVRGDRDEAIEVDQYAEMRRLWPQAEELVVPAGGHEVQMTRRPVLTPTLRDFLDRHVGQG